MTHIGFPRRLDASPRGAGAGALLVLLLIGGCSGIPRDPDGTRDRVARTGSFAVGIIASGAADDRDGRPAAFLERVATRTGATARTHAGTAERLLSQLENGELDIVIGELSEESPWRERVTILPPLGAPIDGRPGVALTVAGRHGENAWLGLLFEEITAAGGTP